MDTIMNYHGRNLLIAYNGKMIGRISICECDESFYQEADQYIFMCTNIPAYNGSSAANKLDYKYSFMIGKVRNTPIEALIQHIADHGFKVSEEQTTLYDLI